MSIVITIAFVWYLVGLASDYREGIRLVASGEYENACEIFTGLDRYQDSEVLAEYCRVMTEYDSYDYASVCRSYHGIKKLEIDNGDLAVEVARARSEIEALYIHVGGVLYG